MVDDEECLSLSSFNTTDAGVDSVFDAGLQTTGQIMCYKHRTVYLLLSQFKPVIDMCNDTRYIKLMIKTFKNRALKKLYEKGDPSKIKADHVERVEDILFRLDNAMQPKDMDLPGWNLHKLSGKLKYFSAVWVSGNFRIWFRMEEGDAFDVDYGDYH